MVDADINAVNHAGETPLYLAVIQRQNGWSIDILLQAGANPNIHKKGKIPLLASCEQANFHNVERLLKAGADINATDILGRSALYIAIQNSAPTYDSGLAFDNLPGFFLSQANINIHLSCQNGETALCIALRKGNFQIVQWLLEMGAKIINS